MTTHLCLNVVILHLSQLCLSFIQILCMIYSIQEELAGVDPRVGRHKIYLASRSSSQDRDSDVRGHAYKLPRRRKFDQNNALPPRRESSEDGSD